MLSHAPAALLITGEWDAAEAELDRALDGDGLADIEFVVCNRAWVAALHGDATAAQAILDGLVELRASEEAQDQAHIAVAEAFTAFARRQPEVALDQARAVLGHIGALGIGHEFLRWGVAAGRPRRLRPARCRRRRRPARAA